MCERIIKTPITLGVTDLPDSSSGEETTPVNETVNTTETEVNYAAEFYKAGEHDYSNFFNIDEESDTLITEAKKKLDKLTKQVQQATQELNDTYAKRYAKKFQPSSIMNIIAYRMRTTYDEIYFSIPSGQLVDLDSIKESGRQYIKHHIDTKNDSVTVIAGYCMELGAIITKQYSVKINAKNDKANISVTAESIIGVLDDKGYTTTFTSKDVPMSDWLKTSIMREVNGVEFFNKFYGVNRTDPAISELTLARMLDYKKDNAAFETIYKTAPESLVALMLPMHIDHTSSMWGLLNVDKNVYEKALSQEFEKELFEMRNFMDPVHKPIFGKTQDEWLNLIRECKTYENDLDLYGIDVNIRWNLARDLIENCGANTTLLSYLAGSYYDDEVFRDNYTLGKFIKYVVKESIDQGYSRINDYVSNLQDYLRMCKNNGIKPTLYSSYLKMTHDITTRNFNVEVSPENETKFANRYTSYQTYRGGEYGVYAPTCTNDLKAEGNELNHCVASYIKRVIDGSSLILFMRKNRDESLITLELQGNAITQARGIHNRYPDDKEAEFIKRFAENRGYEVSY